MRIAAVQCDVAFGDPSANLAVLEETVRAEAAAGSRLIVFPECFLTGYGFESPEEALPCAEAVDGPSVSRVATLCREQNVFVVFGMLERQQDDLYNVAVLVGPAGLAGVYRKTHLPWLGVDRFATFGTEMDRVYEVDGVRVGMLICYDSGFPEPARVLALRGVDLIVLPTNWPPGAESLAEHAISTRAMENNIYFAAANRIGTERGFPFIGRSSVCGPGGRILGTLSATEAGVIRTEIDVAQARNKRIIRVPDKHIIDRIADRRPELYGPISEPHALPRPGRDAAARSADG